MSVHRSRTTRLPAALTGLVGRAGALAAVSDRLDRSRLVCLTGPGGAGKTRLALAVAEHLAPRPVRWIELAGRADAAAVPRALAESLDVWESPGRSLLGSVTGALGSDDWVLVLDNCEHLLPGCADVVRTVLERCPATRVLATSRQSLGVPGEAVWEVPPLDPDEAHELFAERARAAVDGFAADPDAIARICGALDGSPLAIELAAARVRMLSVDDIADALDDRLALSSAAAAVERHRSLRDVLDWSHRLLEPAEQDLFADLSVFAGAFGLDAVRAVHPRPDAVDVLARLVDRSLVTVAAAGGRTRYVLTDTVRLYAAERLELRGTAAAARRRLVDWCVTLAEDTDRELAVAASPAVLDRVGADRANLNAAIRVSLGSGGEPADALRIAGALWRFCAVRGLYREGRAVLDEALAAASPDVSSLRARALLGSGRLAALQCDYADAMARLHDARAAYEQLGDDRGLATVLDYLGSVARERGEYERAGQLHAAGRTHWLRLDDAAGIAQSTHYLCLLAWLCGDTDRGTALGEEALARYRRLDDADGVAGALINLGACAVYGDEPESAADLLEESLARSRGTGHREGVAWSLELLGVLALRTGDLTRSEVLLREALAEHWELGDRWRTASTLETLAAVAVRGGRIERAARTLGAASVLRDEVGTPAPPVEAPLLADTEQRAAAASGARRLGRLAGVDRVVQERLGANSSTVVTGARVDVASLGGGRVTVDGAVLDDGAFGYAKPRELLFFLIERPDATKEQIGAALWPWASATRLRGSFHTTLHHLRAALPPDRIVFASRRYRFDREQPYTYDVEEFERRAGGGVDDLETAVGLYRGDWLVDLPGERWLDERRDELRRGYERALIRLAGLHADGGAYDDAIDVLHRVLVEDPLRESAHRDLMRYYAASGHRGSALRQFATLRDLLRSELSAEPDDETAALHARIRRGS